MALRNLLRRVPVRSLSAPLLGPVHGVLPATAATVPRFLATQSEGGQPFNNKAFLKEYMEREENLARVQAIIDATDEAAREHHKSIRKNLDKFEENIRLEIEEIERFTTKCWIFGGATVATMIAITAFLMDKANCLLAS